MQKQVIDFRASKGITEAQSNEHQRRRSERSRQAAEATGNYDRSREHLNFEIVKGGHIQPVDKSHSIPQRMAASLAARGIRDPNEGLPEPKFRTVVNFILGGSRERMREIAFGSQTVDYTPGANNSHITRTKDIENWALDMYNFMAERYGEDNIVGFYVHLDETNPHLHCTLLPIDKTGRFAYKKIFAGKDKYEYRAKTLALHDALAAVNAKWGLGRGSCIQETGAKHRSTEEYRRQLDDTCTQLQGSIQDHQKTLDELKAQCAIASRRVKGLTTMIENLTADKNSIEQQIGLLQLALFKGEGDTQAQQKRLAELQQQLDETNAKLADKNDKLKEADRQLAQLEAERQRVFEACQDLRRQSGDYSRDVIQGYHSKVLESLFDHLTIDIRNILPSLTKAEIPSVDSQFLEDIAERGNEVISCATLLFAGAIDQATTFAQTHGGGGGGSKKGWGRDPKEDDRQWAFRCMREAAVMTRPAKRKIKR